MFVSFCFLTLNTFSQIPKDTLLASQYYKKADSLLLVKNNDESILFFNKALSLYENAKAWERVADCYNELAQINFHLKKFDVLKTYAKKALEISDSHLSKESKQLSDAYRSLGLYFVSKRDFDKGIDNFNLALLILQKKHHKKHPDIGILFNDLGAINNSKGNFETAIDYLKKALEINLLNNKTKSVAKNYSNIGKSYVRLNKLNLALDYFKKSLEINKKDKKNILNLGKDYNNIGITLIQLIRYSESIPYFLKASSIFKNNKDGQISLSYTYMYFGIVYHYIGENDKALKYFNKSIDIRIKFLGESNSLLVNNYINLGAIYSLKNNFIKAKFFYEKALNIIMNIYGQNHYNISTLYTNMGESFVLMNEYDTALKYTKKALNNQLNIFKKDNPEIANVYSKIAHIYQKQKKLDEALDYYKRGLKIMEKAYGKQSPLLSEFYHNIGVLYQEIKNYNSGLTYFNKALISNSKSKSLKDVFNANNFYDLQLLLKTIQAKSKTLQSQYVLNNSIAYLNQSINLYGDADKIINHLRQSYQNHQDKIALAKQTKDIYNSAIAAQLLRYKDTKNENDLTQAWYYSEKSKSNILKELLEDTNAKKFAGLPDEVLTLEKNIKSNQAYYQSQIVSLQSKDSVNIEKVKNFENELFSISQKKDSLLKTLKENHPKYYQLKHKKSLITVKDIQNKINEKTTLLEFFTKDSITYAFTISKHSISVKELKTLQLAQKVKNLNETIISEDTKAYKKLAYNLYKELIAPIKNQCIGDELVIIPDGPLWHLNFELLLTQENEKQDSRNLSYLLRTYAISYANSANLLFNKTINNDYLNTEIRKECLAFSFSDATNASNSKTIRLETLRNTKEDLPGARKEIKAISEIIDGQYYYGLEADEANFKQNANQYSMLHLALHGEVDDIKPQNSKLYFTKGKDTIEDNMLYNHELFALNIPADLVVLSACNTGSGKIANGEGLMSLGNAFQYAGVKSLLLSKWEVSDRTTPDLMQYFYANIKNGMNKSKALQQAKLKYLNTSETFYTNPFYWGSFYIIGDTNAIPFENHKLTLYYWIIGGMLCLIGIYFLVKKKRYKNTQTT
ncbi:CHAT domain-containing tetratricopeptide repeat protein [uncultured Algibacter sp.]|uniref:CHAT domain-containing tetratricopeptide repeat protein n=1 Tax=uncultured Algibacter sp. TaxID=298659 RepID=UPI0032178A54